MFPGASAEQSGTDLVISFDSGATLTLDDFFFQG